jgi:hypothetical protein
MQEIRYTFMLEIRYFIQKMGFFNGDEIFYAQYDIFVCRRWDILMHEMKFFYAGDEIFLRGR